LLNICHNKFTDLNKIHGDYLIRRIQTFHPNRLKREGNHSIHISPLFPFLVWGNRQRNAGIIIFVVASRVVQI